jgi:hypothetical protein
MSKGDREEGRGSESRQGKVGKKRDETHSLSVLGLVGEDEGDDASTSDGGDTLDDEEPPPAFDAVSARELEDGDGEETSLLR